MFYVNNAKEMAKQEGCYTDEILNELKINISNKMKIKSDEIIIDSNTTKTPKYRKDKNIEGEGIYIKVSVPFNKIIAANTFLNINSNKKYYIIENITTSERIKWKLLFQD